MQGFGVFVFTARGRITPHGRDQAARQGGVRRVLSTKGLFAELADQFMRYLRAIVAGHGAGGQETRPGNLE